MENTRAERIASAFGALQNCIECDNSEWEDRHAETIATEMEHLPHGSGFDSGTTLNHDRSSIDKLVFDTSFHHMNDAGYYDGWTEHRVTVTPSFIGRFDVRVGGRDRNGIKEYITECFLTALDNAAS